MIKTCPRVVTVKLAARFLNNQLNLWGKESKWLQNYTSACLEHGNPCCYFYIKRRIPFWEDLELVFRCKYLHRKAIYGCEYAHVHWKWGIETQEVRAGDRDLRVMQIYSDSIYHHGTMKLTIESVFIETARKLRPGLLVGRKKNQNHWKKKD